MKRSRSLAAALLGLLAPLGCGSVISLGSAPAGGGVDGSDGNEQGNREAGTDGGQPACVELPVGRSVRTTTHASILRTYQVTRAASVDTCARIPAILGFHDQGLTAGSGDDRAMIEEAAGRAGAVAIFVNGSVGTKGVTGWSCFGCSAFAAADDVGLIRAIISELRLDPARVSAIGSGVGGSFVHRLAAELPLTAGAVLAGTLGADPSGGALPVVRPVATAPVTMILAHGEDDRIFPIDGGRTPGGEEVTSLATAFAFWRAASGCTDMPVTRTTSRSMTETVSCGGVTVMATRWRGAKHELPSADPENPALSFTAIVDRLLAER